MLPVQLCSIEKPNEEALNFVKWLTARIKIAGMTDESIVKEIYAGCESRNWLVNDDP